jgi:hypothetical protein
MQEMGVKTPHNNKKKSYKVILIGTERKDKTNLEPNGVTD